MLDNLNYYRVFLAVAKTGSISNAATALYISQPAVSKSISNLEDALGIKLFDRSSRGVILTDEGQILYEHISSAFDNITQAEDEIKRINELGIGQLKIGVSTSLCKHILLDYLKDFIVSFPHIKLTIDCHSTMNTIKLLEEGKIDLGLICYTDLPKNMTYVKLKQIHDVFVTSNAYLENLNLRESLDEPSVESNPWLFAGNVTSLMSALPVQNSNIASTSKDENIKQINSVFEEKYGLSPRDILEKSNLMLLERGNVTRKHIDRYMYDQNINPSQLLEINNMDLLIDFAEIGMGVSSVVKEFAKEKLSLGSIFEIPLEKEIEPRSVGFAYLGSKVKSNALDKFLEYCNLKTDISN